MGMVRSGKRKAESKKQKAESRKRKAESGKWEAETVMQKEEHRALSFAGFAFSFNLLALCFVLCGVQPAHGQEWTFSEPEKLPSTINTAAEEGMPLLSPDGKTLYFTRAMYEGNVGGKFAGQDVWVSSRVDEGWTAASNAFSFNDKNPNAVIGVAAGGNALYLLQASPSRRLRGIYVSALSGKQWSKPEFVPIEGLGHEGFVGLYVSPDFETILISMNGQDSRGQEDIYVSLKDASGNWSQPRNIGPTINTSGFEISPYLSADKKRLYFSSDGHEGFGNADIFYSDRLYDSWETWSVPKNLGDNINSGAFDAYFSSSNDSLAVFVSNRGGQQSDIYMSVFQKPPKAPVTLEAMRTVLTKEEVVNVIGLSPYIYFSSGSSTLREGEIKRIDRMAKRLSNEKDLYLTLIAIAEKDKSTLDLYKERLNNILDELRRSGIEGSRVTFSIETREDTHPEEAETVKLGLYRLTTQGNQH